MNKDFFASSQGQALRNVRNADQGRIASPLFHAFQIMSTSCRKLAIDLVCLNTHFLAVTRGYFLELRALNIVRRANPAHSVGVELRWSLFRSQSQEFKRLRITHLDSIICSRPVVYTVLAVCSTTSFACLCLHSQGSNNNKPVERPVILPETKVLRQEKSFSAPHRPCEPPGG